MKKFMSLATLLCVLAMSFGINVSAAGEIELVWSSIKKNDTKVAINKSLELDFDGKKVDVENMSLANVIVNGSHAMVIDSVINDGKVDGFSWDSIAQTLMIDFKDFDYGTRYTVELIDIPFVGTSETYSDVIRFTTDVPSGASEVIESVDTSGGSKFTWGQFWYDQSHVYNATEAANVVKGGAETLLNYAFTELDGANAFAITARASDDTNGNGSINVYVTSGDNSQWDGGASNSVLMSGSVSFSTKEYKTYYYKFSEELGDDVTAIQFAANPGSSNQVYIKNVALVKMPETVFTNEKLIDLDCTNQLHFSGWNIDNAGNCYVNSGEQANSLEGSWARLDTVVGDYKNADKLIITMKRQDNEAGEADIRFSKYLYDCTGLAGDNVYFGNKVPINAGPDYTVAEMKIEHSETDGATAYVWIAAGLLVKHIEVIPKGYMDGDYYTGEFNVFKNYGTDSEEVKTKAGLEAGKYSAVLNGVHNMKDKADRITIVNALYDGGKLVDIAVAQTPELKKGEAVSEPISATLENVPDYKDGIELKAMVFDNAMKPVKDAISIKDDKRVKVLIFGNSITYHRPATLDGIHWDGAWGMAASKEENDYAHRLVASAENAGYNTEFMIGNALGFESLEITNPVELEGYKAFAPDIVIGALGANVKNASAFLPLYEQFIKDIGAEKNILVSTMWGPNEHWEGVEAFCEKNGWAFVDCLKKSSTTNLGGTLEMDFYTWSAMGLMGDNGVGWHPGDVGMKYYADQIWNEQLNDTIKAVANSK